MLQKWPQNAQGWRNAILSVLMLGVLSADLLLYLGGKYQGQRPWTGYGPFAELRFWDQVMKYVLVCNFFGLVTVFVLSLIFAILYDDKLAKWCWRFSIIIFLFSIFLLPVFARAREKPVIYLYPAMEQKINVKLHYNGKISCTYPEYSDEGWMVLAQPDGNLLDLRTGKNHYCLFWEGVDDNTYDMDEGFVVKGEDTAKFLESKLSILGLNDREKNEFIIYWLPRMQDHHYNLVTFVGEEYAKQAQLEITPPPDTLIRVFMVFKPLKKEINIKTQELKSVTRKGFTVVEWGGSEF